MTVGCLTGQRSKKILKLRNFTHLIPLLAYRPTIMPGSPYHSFPVQAPYMCKIQHFHTIALPSQGKSFNFHFKTAIEVY